MNEFVSREEFLSAIENRELLATISEEGMCFTVFIDCPTSGGEDEIIWRNNALTINFKRAIIKKNGNVFDIIISNNPTKITMEIISGV